MVENTIFEAKKIRWEWDFAYQYLPDSSTTDSFTTSFNLTHPYAMLSYA